jgi:hypothetical protein
MEVPLSQDQPFVSIQSPEAMVWTNRPGLTGSTHKLHQYRPPHIQLAPPGPRPHPWPAYTGAIKTKGRETPGDALSAKRSRDDQEAKVGMPVKKRWITKKQAVVHTPEDDHMMDIPSSPVPL